ncbi:hypothetical protein Tco_1213066 [Tanacetum coccineum]
MAGWKPKDLKTKSFTNVQELFDKAMKRVNTFVDIDTELVGDSEVRAEGSETKEESSSKRTGEVLESDKSKKQKLDEKVEAEVDDAKEAKELKQFHCVTMQNMLFYLLVEKIYPLTKHTLHQMFNNVKLQVDYECEMAYELLRLVKKQLKEGYERIVGIKSLLEVTAVKETDIAQKDEKQSQKRQNWARNGKV